MRNVTHTHVAHIPHTHMSHTCDTHKHVTHTHVAGESGQALTCLSHVTLSNESCHTFERDMSLSWMSHITLLHEHTHSTNVTESRYTGMVQWLSATLGLVAILGVMTGASNGLDKRQVYAYIYTYIHVNTYIYTYIYTNSNAHTYSFSGRHDGRQ